MSESVSQSEREKEERERERWVTCSNTEREKKIRKTGGKKKGGDGLLLSFFLFGQVGEGNWSVLQTPTTPWGLSHLKVVECRRAFLFFPQTVGISFAIAGYFPSIHPSCMHAICGFSCLELRFLRFSTRGGRGFQTLKKFSNFAMRFEGTTLNAVMDAPFRDSIC